MFFAGADTAHGQEVWTSDGTADGTRLLKDINDSGNESSFIGGVSTLMALNNDAYFIAETTGGSYDLWRSHGTASSTQLLEPNNSIFPAFTRSGRNLYYVRSENDHGGELWKFDPILGKSTLVKDIRPGTFGSSISNLTNVSGTLYFVANDGMHGSELWKSDGTEQGTLMVKDIGGPLSSAPWQLASVDGNLYFSADDGVTGQELWKSDGTEAGTVLVADIAPGRTSSSIQSITNVNGIAYFVANDSVHGNQLWKSDGSRAGTGMVKAVVASVVEMPKHLTSVDGKLYFTANDGITGEELWTSDGTGDGTHLVKDLVSGSSGSSPWNLIAFRGKAYFNIITASGSQLWSSDGTSSGTSKLVSAEMRSPAIVNDELFFGSGSAGTLWQSDGTTSGTFAVPLAGTVYPTDAQALTAVGNRLFYIATTPDLGYELYVVDMGGPAAARDDSFVVDEDVPLTNINVLANDSGDPSLAISRVDAITAAGGIVVVNEDETLNYTPPANYFGRDSFTYTLLDGDGEFASATVSFTINSINDVPVAAVDAFTTDEDTAVTGNVLTNDSDVDGDTLTATLKSDAAHSSVSLQANGNFTYTPAANYNGADSFTYTLADGKGGSVIGSVSLAVISVNDLPFATNDAFTTDEDTAVTDNVLTNDSDVDGDALAAALKTDVAHGTVVLQSDGSFTYTPNANYNGVDSFTYTLSDGHGGAAVATVSLTINSINDVPVPVNDAASLSEDEAIMIRAADLLANDFDADNDTLVIDSFSAAIHGTLTFTEGVFHYTPTANYYGSDAFTYTVSDGHGSTAEATVQISVSAVNDAPAIGFTRGVVYPRNSTPIVLAPAASLSDIDSQTFAGGTVMVKVITGSSTTDRIGLLNNGTTLQAAVIVDGQTIGTIAGTGQGTSSLIVNLNDHATLATVTKLLQAVTFGTIGATTNGTRVLQFSLREADGVTSNLALKTLYLSGNDAAVIRFTEGISYNRNTAPLVLSPGATLTDLDTANYSGGKLVVGITSGGSEHNRLAVVGSAVAIVGTDVLVNNVSIGVITGSGEGQQPLSFAFNAKATPLTVQTLIRSVAFSTTGEINKTTRSIAFTLTDGSNLASAPAMKTVYINGNDRAVLGFSSGVNYKRETAPLRLSPNATLTDGDTANYANGNLAISIVAGGDIANRISVAGRASITDGKVIVDSVEIGSVASDGVGTNMLKFQFTSAATQDRVRALLQAITFATSGTTTRTTRQLQFVLTDGMNLSSLPATKYVYVV